MVFSYSDRFLVGGVAEDDDHQEPNRNGQQKYQHQWRVKFKKAHYL